MKAFINSMLALIVISLIAAVTLSFLPTSAQQNSSNIRSVRL